MLVPKAFGLATRIMTGPKLLPLAAILLLSKLPKFGPVDISHPS